MSGSKLPRPLVEWAIVAAVLAILIALALPDPLPHHPRSPVSRTLSNFRTIHTGVESWAVDNGHYPAGDAIAGWLATGDISPHGLGRETVVPTALTTPVAYLTGLPTEQFGGEDWPFLYAGYAYADGDQDRNRPLWVLSSMGPDEDYDFLPQRDSRLIAGLPETSADLLDRRYDPSNGTVSNGDVFIMSNFLGYEEWPFKASEANK
ncbi:MAG: hypothetical protein RLY93_05705 [Sumerlaeia bacterium]